MSAALWSFADSEAPARRLASELGLPWHPVSVRQFPDGESLVRVEPHVCDVAVLYRSLDDPNAKLVELLLAASALRDARIRKVVLVAPYLAYMRQDMAFHPGEAVSQRVMGKMIAQHFDGLVTVDPHLHRVSTLGEVVAGIETLCLSAAPALVDALRTHVTPDTVLIGPDEESHQWVSQFAEALNLQSLVGRKRRDGDRSVAIELAGIEQVAGRPIVLVDDLISSGGTLLRCASLLAAAGASRIEVVATHCLATEDDLARLHNAGIARIRASDAVPGPVATVPLAAVIKKALTDSTLLQGW